MVDVFSGWPMTERMKSGASEASSAIYATCLKTLRARASAPSGFGVAPYAGGRVGAMP
jgi:hypothetical protein